MPWMDTAANPADEASYHAARVDERLWRWARELQLSRRRLLQLLTMGASSVLFQRGGAWRLRGAQAASPEDLVLKPAPPELFFDYDSTKEMRGEQLYPRGYVVPNALFFVRKHTRTPRLEVSTWRLTIRHTRREIAKYLRRNPGLQHHPAHYLAEAYDAIREDAAIDTDLPLATFPETCPWPMERVTVHRRQTGHPHLQPHARSLEHHHYQESPANLHGADEPAHPAGGGALSMTDAAHETLA